MRRVFARWAPAIAAAAAAALGAGCGAPQAPLVVAGRLVSAGPIDAPGGAIVVVELRAGTDGPVLAEQRGRLLDRQPPLAFELRLASDRVPPGSRPMVRGAVLAQGWTQWLSDPVEVRGQAGRVDVGELSLAPAARPLAFQTVIDCGQRRFVVGMAGDSLRLVDGDAAFDLRTTADGRMGAKADPTTYVDADAGSTVVSIRGQVFDRCVRRNE